MWMKVEITATGTLTSVACVSLACFTKLDATWGSYVSLKCCGAHRARIYRLEIDEKMSDEGIRVDHWPSWCKTLQVQGHVNVTCIAPLDVPVVQYLALAPADDRHPKLALSFVKRLLRNRILTGRADTVALQCDGLDYGEWRYNAYFRGCTKDGKCQVMTFGGGIVTSETMVLMFPSATSLFTTRSNGKRTYEPVGTHARGFREMVAMAIRMTSSYRTRDAFVTYSFLLHAPSGAGKTTLVEQSAEELGANLLVLDAGVLASPQLRLEDFFSAALRIQPCVLLLEDLELLFSTTLDETKYKLVCRLVNCIENIRKPQLLFHHKASLVRIAIVGTVTVLNALHSKVRQVFAQEVILDVSDLHATEKLGVPDTRWTVELLASLLPSSCKLRLEFLTSLAVRYGQRASKVVAIAQEICRQLSREDSQTLSTESFEAKIAAAAREIASSSNGIDSITCSVPDVSWEDIGGLESVKQYLQEMVVWPLERPEVFCRMGISPPTGIVLHGPPGTGKTMLAKAAAKASGCNFINLVASDLMKGEVGESEKAITRIFDTARALSPCMVFIDEFQSLFGTRSTAGQTTSRMISQLLMELDALKVVSGKNDLATTNDMGNGRIFVLVATNALSAIDPAFLQPGRFENVAFVGLPNVNERKAILEIQRNKMPWNHDVDITQLVEVTDGVNAASMIALCQSAAIQAMQRIPSDAPSEEQCIAMVDFVAALADMNVAVKSYR
ncbi:hypothetical protein PsorP6_004498 [Peronosclerospora sorghi]|uniref:Uncharacterized protein n=1 Tax=Peronosclerospora sorghi TaxID=230839 RepID=A0ACC0VKP7_9STRA|nr:hypothetical protein PsorP6_004498 [Peronosclerospora sorghi]